jgi:hypothetical protein
MLFETYSGNGFCWPMIRRWHVETCSSHRSDSDVPEYALGRVKGGLLQYDERRVGYADVEMRQPLALLC